MGSRHQALSCVCLPGPAAPLSELWSPLTTTCSCALFGPPPYSSLFDIATQAYMFLMTQMAIALFRFLAAAARNFDVANSYGSLALIIVLVMSGFVMARSESHCEHRDSRGTVGRAGVEQHCLCLLCQQ